MAGLDFARSDHENNEEDSSMRKLLRRATQEDIPMADSSSYSTPRWVKVFGIIALILVLLVVIMIFTGIGGPHGPGRHMPSGDAGSPTPPIEHGVQQP